MRWRRGAGGQKGGGEGPEASGLEALLLGFRKEIGKWRHQLHPSADQPRLKNPAKIFHF